MTLGPIKLSHIKLCELFPRFTAFEVRLSKEKCYQWPKQNVSSGNVFILR